MSDASKLIVKADLRDFFREEVTASVQQLNLRLGEATEYYLVNLLAEFSRRDDVVDLYKDEPLVVLHRRATLAPLAEQLTIYKQMGDWALYVAGFFAEFIERSLVNLDYYVSMGTAAYSNLAALSAASRRPRGLNDLYRALSQDFARIVDVLTQVCYRARARNHSDIDLLKLYDRYVRTQNDRVKKMLEGQGLLVDGAVRMPSTH